MLTFVLFSECQMAPSIVCIFPHPDLLPRHTHICIKRYVGGKDTEYDIRMWSRSTTNLRGPFLQPDPDSTRVLMELA